MEPRAVFRRHRGRQGLGPRRFRTRNAPSWLFFEAAEQLLAEGYTPPTDVYLASSCTEEWAGDGAPKLVAELQRRGVELFLVCDEGGAIISSPSAASRQLRHGRRV